MTINKTKLFIILFILLLLLGLATALAAHVKSCKKELREVDRYAVPYIIEFMEVLATWDYKTIEPYLTDRYKNLYSPVEWQKQLDEYSVLGKLYSFARPRFVSHNVFKRYAIFESAIDIYSISTEYEKDNALVQLQFVNHCGSLKVKTIKLKSDSIKTVPDYLRDLGESNITDLPEDNQSANSQEEDSAVPTEPSNPTAKSKPKGKIYRY